MGVKLGLTDAAAYNAGLEATVERMTDTPESSQHVLTEGALDLGRLDPARYRITVGPAKRSGSAPRSVTEVFEVAGEL